MGLSLKRENRSGSKEWIFQRVSNIAIIVWLFVYLGLVLSQSELTYETWSAMHSALWFKLYSTVTLVLAMFNSILAGWQIGTDYTQKVSLPGFDKGYHAFYFLVTIVYLVAGLAILWC
jgi:succinate dehydrogenase / fumarate reductase membrane anchor subunit